MAIPKNWTSITTSTVTHMNKIESQKNSRHWNVQFHPMKRTIPSYETHSFILWNAPFQCLKIYGCQYLTNHVLLSDKRIASKFGVGKFNNVYGISGNNVTAGQKDYAARMMQIEKQCEEYYKSLGTLPGVPTMKGATADPDNTLKFSTNGELLNSGVGLKSISGMEIEAYKMQYSYDGTFPGNLGGRGLQGIDVHSVGGIMNDGKPVYPAINQYSIDLNKFSKQQKKLMEGGK